MSGNAAPADGLNGLDREVVPPVALNTRVAVLSSHRVDRLSRLGGIAKQIQVLDQHLGIAGKVTDALDQLSQQLFRELLDTLERSLTVALQEILEQPIVLKSEVDFKNNRSVVDFWIERDGNREDVLHGQGGSVANVLSVGLRMFALVGLDPKRHRHFLVLDEQDCWLRPELVPRLVKIVQEAGEEFGLQVLMISHHDVSLFERYADKIYRLEPEADGSVSVHEVAAAPAESDDTP